MNMLIEDWKQAWRYLSVQANAIFSTAVIVWLMLDKADQEALLALLPFGDNGGAKLVLICFVASIIARLKAQPSVAPPSTPPPTDPKT